MENKLKTFFKSHLWLIILIGLAVLAFTVFGIQSGCSTLEFNRTIDNQSNQSNKAVQEAVNAQNAAVNVTIERRAEDQVREKSITPKLTDARRRSQNSKDALEAAKQKLNETEKTLHNLNASRAANCAELRRLFPNEQFEYCLDR